MGEIHDHLPDADSDPRLHVRPAKKRLGERLMPAER